MQSKRKKWHLRTYHVVIALIFLLMCNRCCFLLVYSIFHMGVSKNSGTPKSSILIGISLINHPFWGTHIFGNPHMVLLGWFFHKSLGCWGLGLEQHGAQIPGLGQSHLEGWNVSSKVEPAKNTHEPRLCCWGCCVCGCGGCCCCCCCCLLLFVVVVVVVVVVFVVVLALRTRRVFVPLPPPRPRRLPGATIMMTLPALEPTERAFGTNQGKKWTNGGEKGD